MEFKYFKSVPLKAVTENDSRKGSHIPDHLKCGPWCWYVGVGGGEGAGHCSELLLGGRSFKDVCDPVD